MSERTLLIAILVMALITAALRFLPFVVLGGRKSHGCVDYLSKTLPYAIMGMLVVYCLKDMSFSSAAGFVPYIAGTAVTAAVHAFKKNTIFSILAGTAIYMILIRIIH